MPTSPSPRARALGIAAGLLALFAPRAGMAIERNVAAPPLAPTAAPPPAAAPPPQPAPPASVPTSRTRVTSAQPSASTPEPQQPAPRAEAQDATTVREVDTRFAGAALLGFATDQLNLGIGVRLGKTLSNRVYVGGSFVYNFGESQTTTTIYGNATSSFSAFYVGPEGGYDFDVGPVVIRPYAGLGVASLKVSVSGPGASAGASDTKFVIWPGGMVIYSVPDSPWFVGGDVRFVTIPGGPAVGIVGFGGLHFGS